jgi:hypothetical protein
MAAFLAVKKRFRLKLSARGEAMQRRIPPVVRPSSGGIAPERPPLFPASFGLIGSHADWRSTWTHIVAGKFSNSPYSSLFFYEQSTGYGEFYDTDGAGGVTFFQSYFNQQNSWTHIVSGAFYGPGRTGLLFYDQAAGFAAIYDPHTGNVREYSGWRTSWTHSTTVRVNIIHPDNAISDFPALVLYDQAAGHLEIHRCMGSGGLEFITQKDDFVSRWTHVAGDCIAGPGLLFYDASTSHGEIYSISGNETNGYKFDTPPATKDGLPPATDITPGNFGWFDTGFLFYDRASGQGTFVYSDIAFGGISVSDETYAGWPTSWDIIVSGVFWAADPEDLNFQNGFTSLLFYDRTRGYGEFDFHAPFEATLARTLDGYVSPASVVPGETVSFYVNSQVGPFTIKIYQQDESADGALMAAVDNIQQLPQLPIGRLDYRDGPAWPPAADFVIPQDWPSGLYLARAETTSVGVAGDTLTIPFVVRAAVPASQSKILLYIDDVTYEAYNFWGGRSLYGFAGLGSMFFTSPGSGDFRLPRAYRVSFRRPYRHFYEEPPHGITKWQKWEVPLIRWLVRQGIAVELCTATDLHKDQANHAGMLQNYQLLVCVGHHEYWSKEMRDNVESFAEGGGNVVFFSGNVCWWQARFDLNVQRTICYKGTVDPYAETQPDLATVNWYDQPVCRAETSLTGVSWYNSIEQSLLYRVVEPNHWAFTGLGFFKKSFFGLYKDQDGVPRSVLGEGTEVDKYQSPQPDPCLPSSPLNFLVLADVPPLSDPGNIDAPPAGTMGIFAKGQGQVITVGTINWSLGLSQDGGWNEIDQITRNVFDRLGGGLADDCASGGPYPAVNLGAFSGNGSIDKSEDGDVTVDNVTNGFNLRLTSQHGRITISHKVDQHSSAILTACAGVSIAEKIDQHSSATIFANGDVTIGQKIDEGSFADIKSMNGAIDIGQKVDQHSTAILQAQATVHIGQKIDQHSNVTINAQGDITIDEGIDQHAKAYIKSENGSIIIGQAVDGGADATLIALNGSVTIGRKVAGGASVKWSAQSFTCPDASGGTVTNI